MIRTLDFNAFSAGTVVDDEYADLGVTVSASGGSGQAMVFDSSNPTGGDSDLGSDTLEGLLIVSEDGDQSDPDDNAGGGSLFFDFEDGVQMKSLTFKDIEETGGEGTRMIFYDANGNVIDNQFVDPTGDGGERTVLLNVQDVSRMEVRFEGSGAIDNVTFDDGQPQGGGNDAPVAEDDMLEIDEDTSGTVDVLGNDTDANGDTLTITMASCPVGDVVINDDGTLTFTPNADFNGDTTITYTVDDGNGGTDTGTVNVTVNPVNDAPVANDDTASTTGTDAVVIPVLENDTDVDGDVLSVADASSDDGTVTINDDGTITFEADDGFTGDATITYTVSDPDGLTDEGTVTVTVGDGGATRDGYVDGTAGADLIDTAYTGDPDGDMIDNDDALLPGAEGDDDYVRAGDGDDTILAGDGDDIVEGGAGSDEVYGGDGDDMITTGNGDIAPDLGYPESDSDSLSFDPDTDPENDRDYVDGGAGNDTISTGDDRDTIYGGTGDDVINAGIDDDFVDGGDGDDRIVGGEGNDSLLGGAGNDTIYAGNDPDLGLDVLDIPDEEDASNPFTPDRNPTNGMDTVDGGAGDDVIYGADDADLLRGGSGDDYIDGQIDDDIIEGNTGNDTLLGGQGDDSISGGQGNDMLYGGTGDDTLRGNRDDDYLEGGEGNDLLDGGGENDTLMGGEGDDTLMGGQGDDLLDGGAGVDVMTGGADQDSFVNVNAGDDVDGGSAGVDFDTLDLRGSAPEGGRLEVTYTSDDREDGFVDYFNEDGSEAGRLNFVEIENVIPCFTPGTKIATPKGEVRVEELQVGDRVITRDNGIQTIRWVGAREMTGAEFEMAAHLKPVLIRKGALGNALPERDMMVSPNHRVLVANEKTALYFEEREVLVAAKHLTGMDGIDVVEVSGTTYIHVMFDRHEVILSDGTWTESFQPGDMSLAGIGEEQRNEILELFPELATQEGIEGYTAARRSLKKHEASLLVK
ncbi:MULTISPECIES: Hint domain-containing protein [Sulfitobacter]|uniref:Leukotoxin n=1 Tax=Sulfitobacter dubius TaxID=218673 RepID=A0ABY3ZIX3_9RHOB|nr:Hint domain-containing protein [Sulfitobacter dubius]UOA14612.1 Leukotoxin [Sulfitobacter dubius]WOI29930.1 Hint domain-containing protein [Sulfitobacter dubius]